jgi:threonine dehydratase
MSELVGEAELHAARERIGDALRVTPVIEAVSLRRRLGRQVLLKAENLQRTGSFKPRGALNVMRSLDRRVTDVVAASAGNHAQGVAMAASMTDRRATVFMPSTASLPKVEATRDYGAEVVLGGETVDDAIRSAEAAAAATGARFVSPFDDPLVIAGQGTLGLELIEQVDEAATVLVPVGGGGLVSGVAVALRADERPWRVIGVEAAGAASMTASLAAGEPMTIERSMTMADGIALKAPSELTLAHTIALVDDVVTVNEEAIAAALLLVLERARLVIEPAAAVGLAAVLEGLVPGDGPILAVLSGGNVDSMLLGQLVDHGLSVAGRFLRLRVIVPDRPGGLADVTAAVADLGLNVIDVEHHRAGVSVGIQKVELSMMVETRDTEHGDEVLGSLQDAGFEIEREG